MKNFNYSLSSGYIFYGISIVSAAAADDTAATESNCRSSGEQMALQIPHLKGFVVLLITEFIIPSMNFIKYIDRKCQRLLIAGRHPGNCLVYGSTAPITKMTDLDGGRFHHSSLLLGSERELPESECLTPDLDSNAKAKRGMVPTGGFYNGSSIEGACDGKNLSDFGDSCGNCKSSFKCTVIWIFRLWRGLSVPATAVQQI